MNSQQQPSLNTVSADSSNSDGRISGITAKILDVMLALSGTEIPPSDIDKTFFELGMDSLLLTQAASKMQNEFGVAVKFRQLVDDLSSPSALAHFFDKSLPPEAFVQPVQSAAPQPTPPSPETPMQPLEAKTLSAPAIPVHEELAAQVSFSVNGKSPLAQVISQQLAVMSRQLEMLTGKKLSSAGIAPSHSAEAALTPGPKAPMSGIVEKAVSPAIIQKPDASGDEIKKFVGPALRINKSQGEALSTRQQRHLAELTQRYTAKTKSSKEFTQKHRVRLADPRAVSGFRPLTKELIYPIVVNRSQGARLWDIDGNEYIDLLNGFGSNFFGHRAPFVIKAVKAQLDTGIEIGPQHPLAGELADMLCEFLGHDRVAFCNTGSEAVLGAMRLSRTVTARDKIAMFVGAYHGICDEVIVRGTKKLRSIPAAPGIQPGAVENILVLDYATPETLDILKARAGELAAIMVEPVQSRLPELQPREFLHELRKIADTSGCALIIDEVVTGFRTCPGGAQEYFDVKADIATYGKVLGGGMNIGVIAGKSRFMDALDGGQWNYGDASIPEVGVTYFAGTFVRHPPALVAAKAVLEHLKAKGPKLQQKVNEKTARFAETLNSYFEAVGVPLKITYFASVMRVAYTEEIPNGELLFVHLREKGVHIWDHRPCFLTTAHTDDDINFVIDAFKRSIEEMQRGEFLPAPINSASALDGLKPPQPDARLGRDPEGNPAWFVPDPGRQGKFLQLGRNA